MNTKPQTGVTIIIQRSMCGGWFADCYGPKGAALAHQPRQVYPTIEAARHAARRLYGPAVETIKLWSPEHGYQEVDA